MRKLALPLGIVFALLLGGGAVFALEWYQYRRTTSLEQMMEAIVAPASDAIFNAAVWVNGEPTALPDTPEEWEAVEHGAITLIEASNLLLLPARSEDWGDWRRFARDLGAAAEEAERASRQENVDQLLAAGDRIYLSCTNCHRKYLN